jgi:hypothetical protein
MVPMMVVPCLSLAACQGLDWGGEDDDDATDAAGDDDASVPSTADDAVTADFSSGPVFLTVRDRATVTPGDPAASTGWDLRVDDGRFNLNGGESGPGEAWGFGPVGVGEADYESLTDHTQVTIQFQFTDEFESIMTDWYLYEDRGHTIYSRYHVYALQVDPAHIYKVQVLSYYGELNGSPQSGIIDLRWAPIDDTGAPREVSLDARAGGSRNSDDYPFTYFSFSTGSTVALTDEEAETSAAWDFAFKRYNVKLNGGLSGSKGVSGFDFQAGREETLDEVKGWTADSQLPDFEAADSAGIDGPWVEDRIGCILNTAVTLDDQGNPIPTGNVYVISGADGTSYYKLLVTAISDHDVTMRIAPIL